MKTVSSRVEKIVFLYSRSWLERKEGNRYVERILSLLGAANDWKEVERRRRAWKILLHGMNRWQVLKWNYIVVGRVCARETDLERNERGYRVYTTGLLARGNQRPIYFLAVVTNDWQLSMLSLSYQHNTGQKIVRFAGKRTYVRTGNASSPSFIYARRSQPRLFIIVAVQRSAILDRRCVSVT